MDLMDNYNDGEYAYNSVSLHVPFEPTVPFESTLSFGSTLPFSLPSQADVYDSQRIDILADGPEVAQYLYGRVPPLSVVSCRNCYRIAQTD